MSATESRADRATAESAAGTPAQTSIDPTRGAVWRAIRAPLGVLLIILITGALIGYLNSRQKHGALDPRVYDPPGSRALATLLAEEGVSVDLVRTTEEAVARAGDGTTLLILLPALLQEPQLDALAGAATDRIVLVEPSEESLEKLAPGIIGAGVGEVEKREPACSLRAASRAGEADAGGLLMEAKPGAGSDTVLCYASGGKAALVSVRTGNREVVAWGSAVALTNDHLDDHGNAALAMNLLGQESRLVWYLPSLGDALATEEKSAYELMPAGWKWGFLQAAIAVLLLAVWRMRRLGPVVAEPLPVVVRAAETVEGRARLYRRAQARDRAAEVLRAAARERLAPLVGQSTEGDPAALVDAVTARVGRAADDVGALLYGSKPVDDAALIRLASELDALEREVRRS